MSEKTIKKASGEFLLYLYQKQKKHGSIDRNGIQFHIGDSEARIVDGHSLNDPLLFICENDVPLAYNVVKYLVDKKMLKIRSGLGGGPVKIFREIEMSESGIDMIEGIEGKESERERFAVTFNIKLADNINVESLIKAELGSLIKASLL